MHTSTRRLAFPRASLTKFHFWESSALLQRKKKDELVNNVGNVLDRLT